MAAPLVFLLKSCPSHPKTEKEARRGAKSLPEPCVCFHDELADSHGVCHHNHQQQQQQQPRMAGDLSDSSERDGEGAQALLHALSGVSLAGPRCLPYLTGTLQNSKIPRISPSRTPLGRSMYLCDCVCVFLHVQEQKQLPKLCFHICVCVFVHQRWQKSCYFPIFL